MRAGGTYETLLCPRGAKSNQSKVVYRREDAGRRLDRHRGSYREVDEGRIPRAMEYQVRDRIRSAAE